MEQSLPEKEEIQFDFLNEKSESIHREHGYPKIWGGTISFDLPHLPVGNYDVQIKSESRWCIGTWRLKNQK